MNRYLSALLSLCFTAGFANTCLGESVIRNVKIVDVEAASISEAKDISIDDGKIVAIANAGPPGALGSTSLDGNGSYVIPGLWDAHVHVFSSAEEHKTAFDLYVINGVTTIRDMGALVPLSDQKRIAADVEEHRLLGPQLILSGAWVDAAPGSWPGMFLADNATEARDRVNEISSQGWAAVKSYSMLSEDTYLALAEAAKSKGLDLVGHIPESVTLETAISAGHRSMEHFGRLTKACSTRENDMINAVKRALQDANPRDAMIAEMAKHNQIILDTWSADQCDKIIKAMASADMHIVPTLIVSDFYVGKRPSQDDPKMRTLPRQVSDAWSKPDFRLEAMTDDLRKIADQSIALDWATFVRAYRSGVPMMAGTDASFANPFIFHGFSLIDELQRYVDAGLTPGEALMTATVVPAKFFKLPDQNGRVEIGSRADLVLLKTNPLKDLSALRNPYAVVVNGTMLDRTKLDLITRELEARAKN